MEVLTDCEGRLRDAISKKILVEVALLKAIEARGAASIESVLKQLQQLRDDNGCEIVAIPAPAQSPAAPPDGPPPVRGASRSAPATQPDRKSTRLNSSHSQISYAVFCLKKKT